jgi:hypothetical protein
VEVFFQGVLVLFVLFGLMLRQPLLALGLDASRVSWSLDMLAAVSSFSRSSL